MAAKRTKLISVSIKRKEGGGAGCDMQFAAFNESPELKRAAVGQLFRAAFSAAKLSHVLFASLLGDADVVAMIAELKDEQAKRESLKTGQPVEVARD